MMGIDGQTKQTNILYKSKPVSLADGCYVFRCYVISEIHRSNVEKGITEQGKAAAVRVVTQATTLLR
jgi:hypothetical protein